MDNMEVNEKRRGIILTIFTAFKEGIGGLINSESINEEEEAKDNPTLKKYVKENQDNPNIEELLKPIKAEEMLKEKKGKHSKVVQEVKVQPTNVRNAIVQEISEQEKEGR